MQVGSMPWKQIIEFHREIAIRSEESFFSFGIDDQSSECFSYMRNEAVQKMQVDSRMRLNMFSNQLIFANVDQKNSEFYIGGIFWFTNKMVDGGWIKIAHPLFYKAFNIKKDASECLEIEPEQAKWDISPMFYKLLDKKGIVLEGNLEEILLNLIERASQKSDEEGFDGAFISLFTSKFPELKKEFVENAPRGFQRRWLTFVAPKDFSAIQRNLILDYSKLLEKLNENSDVLGGFELFEKHGKTKKEKISVTPIVPLNNNQLKVVEKVISGNEVTVVSGPPGCGKSQVVISILLNAWEKGQSTLFASSNNQAVDVVRERMRQFEKQVPMVVRCGAKKTSELMMTLDKMISIVDNYDDKSRTARSAEEIAKLESDLQSVIDLVNSNLPQRIDELARAALGAYGKAGEHRESWESELALYEERLKENWVTSGIEKFEANAYEQFKKWLEIHEFILDAIKRDNENRRNLQTKIGDLSIQVLKLLEEDYTESSGERLFDQDKVDEIISWYANYKEFLLQLVETDLKEVEWISLYEEWKSAEDASKWIAGADEFLEAYSKFNDKYSIDINEINHKQERLRKAKEALSAAGIKELNATKEEVLKLWVILNNKYVMMPKKFGDALPFSEKRKIDKQLTEYEAQLIDLFNTTYMSEYAPDLVKRRCFISTHSDELFEEYVANQDIADIMGKLSTLQTEQKTLNDMLKSIGITNIETVLNINDCRRIIEYAEEKIKIAKEAKVAYEKRDRRNVVIKKDRDLKFKGAQLMYPLMAGIKCDSEVSRFFELVNGNIYTELTLEFLKDARKITYNHSVDAYIERLKRVSKLWDDIDETFAAIGEIKEESKYKLEWMEACPETVKGAFSKMSYSNMVNKSGDLKGKLDEIYADWSKEGKKTIDQLKVDEDIEYDWAWDSIRKALDICPQNVLPDNKENIIAHIKEKGWDVSYIRNLFSKISSEGIIIRQSRIKTALEDALLTQAVSTRMTELYNNNDAKAALTKLYMDYKKTNEVITKQGEDDFANVLRALPLWITTGQSPQAIPMKPGIFDLLIVDEATQCTITSILPLIYRCKKIIVIGDMDQLPSIDNISISAEKFIADKYNVENHLYLLGHCGCNIYKSVLNMYNVHIRLDTNSQK